MKYEITIRQLEEYTKEEKEDIRQKFRNNGLEDTTYRQYSDKSFHEIRILQAEVSKEEFEAVKKAIIGIM